MESKRYNVWKIVYQLKISLCIDEEDEFEAKIWRRIQIPHNYTFTDLHLIIQAVMGWTKNLKRKFTVKSTEVKSAINTINANKFFVLEDEDIPLTKYLNLVERFVYYYYNLSLDGNFWDHEIQLEMILPEEVGVKYPRCIAGERACPPDDCGGTDKFSKLIEIVTNPEHEEYADAISQFGWFDPDGFTVKEANCALELMKK